MTRADFALPQLEPSAADTRGYYTGHAKSLGKLLLMARRLCEAGCGFVTDPRRLRRRLGHARRRQQPQHDDGMDAVGRSFDHAVAAFIDDVEARGLDDKILLVATGEMGRTPRINRNGGRDHWARLAPLHDLRRRHCPAAASSANRPATAANRRSTRSTTGT